jgi:hypothetical protein
MPYDLGDVIPLTVEVRDSTGNLANAGAVALTLGLPDGTSVSFTPSNPSTGRYQYDYATIQAGRHTVRWVATGQNASAYTDAFDVRPSEPPSIMSLSAAKAAINIPADATVDDEELRSLVEAVTSAVETYRGEAIVRRTVVENCSFGRTLSEMISGTRIITEQYADARSRRLVLNKAPVISLTSLVRPYDGVTWAIGSDTVLVDPAAGVVMSYTVPFYGDITATYVAGYQVIPANFIEAAKIILRHLWQTQQTAGFGPRLFSSADDLSSHLTATVSSLGFAIPNRASELLGGKLPVVG